MRKLLLATALLLLAAPSTAATRACTAGLVTAGICRVSTNRVISYDLPPAAATELADAIAASGGCAEVTTTTCSTACTAPLISNGACSSGQLGTAVTVTKAAFADAAIRALLLTYVRQFREDQAVAPVRATARSTADPDISN